MPINDIHNNIAVDLVLLHVRSTDENIPQIVDAIREGAKPEKGVCRLKKINLSHTNINDDDAKLLADAIAEHPSITILDLDHCNLSKEAANSLVEAICTNPRLVNVYLQGNPQMDAEDAARKITAARHPNLLHFHPAEFDIRLKALLARNAKEAERLAYKIIVHRYIPITEDLPAIRDRLPAILDVVANGHIMKDSKTNTCYTLEEFLPVLDTILQQKTVQSPPTRERT